MLQPRLAITTRRAGASFSISALRLSQQKQAQEADAPSPPSVQASAPKKWTPFSMRTGLIARKRGMTTLWSDQGKQIPVTVLQLDNCQVTAHVKSIRRNRSVYHAIQLSATNDKAGKHTTRQMAGHFRKAGVAPKRLVKEFPVTPDALVPIGTTLNAIHFVPGQYVDVVSKSIGKGFQGGMKRWGFGGLAASHGVSVSHRKIGSTGQHQDPGRVFPGKKMPGHMGNVRVTTQNLPVLRIDTVLNLIYVKGCIPGIDDAQVLVRDATKKMVALAKHNQIKGLYEKVLPTGVDDLPFPAGTEEMANQEGMPKLIESPAYRRSPFIPMDG